MSRYSVGRSITKQIMKEDRKRRTHGRMLKDAAARPESIRVETAAGEIWMSPIEYELYQAMRREGLSPIPQFRVDWYTLDFAFPDIKVAIEADGASYHSGNRREHDRKRDSSLRRAGWTMKRFYGTTIHHKAANCAYIIKQEVEGRRTQAEARARQEEIERLERRDALLRPFRKVTKLVKRSK